MQKVRSVEELLEYASQVAKGEVEYQPVEITADKLLVELKIDGDNWDKRINVTHAKYLIALQKEFDYLLDEFAPEVRISGEEPLVQTEVKEGSTDLWQDVKEILVPLLSNMTNTQIFILAMTGVAATTGFLAWGRWLNYKVQLKEKNIEQESLTEHEETKRQILQPLIDMANAAPQEFSRYERPVGGLFRALEDEDSVALVGEGYIPAESTKKLKPPRVRSEKMATSCDGDFQLMDADYSSGEYILHVKQNGIPLKAYTTALDDEAKDHLIKFIADKTNEGDLPFDVPLQITVEHTSKKILSGNIIGLGAPRPGRAIKTLSQLLPED